MPFRLIPPFSFRTAAQRLTVAIVAVSIVFGLLGSFGVQYLLFQPVLTWRALEAWRPFTALLIAGSPIEIIFGGLIVYSLGSSLERSWGPRRFLRVVLGLPLAAMGLTVGLSLLFPAPFSLQFYTGVTCIITGIWICYGCIAQFSGQMLNFWGVALTGQMFAFFGFGFVLLDGVFNGWMRVVPNLFTAALAFGLMHGKLRFTFLDRVADTIDRWKLKRLRSKRGLKVVPKPGRSDRDPYLH
jgi:membrane associated rhomboid family serine protease